MRQKKILSAVLAGTVMSFILLNPVSAEESIRYKDVSFSGVAVNNGVPVKGVDISSVISLEDSGVVFRDAHNHRVSTVKIADFTLLYSKKRLSHFSCVIIVFCHSIYY